MKKEIIIAKDKEHLKKLIKDCIDREGHDCNLNHIDTSLVTDMSGMFYSSIFNGDISEWKVSNVTDMSHLFCKSNFSGDISEWNVSKVTNMMFMFAGSKFNRDISQWNVSNVKYMSFIFDNRQIKITPYWSKIENFEERKKAVLEYQENLENKKLLEKLIKNQSSTNVIHKI